MEDELLEMMLRDCPDGLRTNRYNLEELSQKFPDESEKAIEDAAHDLENSGLADIVRPGQGWHIRLNESSYAQGDARFMGWNPYEDAKTLATTMLKENTGVSADLIKSLGWEKRRFNPALRVVMNAVPDGIVSKTKDTDYVTPSISLTSPSEAALRQLRDN